MANANTTKSEKLVHVIGAAEKGHLMVDCMSFTPASTPKILSTALDNTGSGKLHRQRAHETLWCSVRFSGAQWFSLGLNGSLWGSLELLGIR